ncbi:MAG TPA: type II toxin-antitoxin system VapC family toxin [Candidatus Desulfobacillus sp.]|nr:type II toxin-antitoxin system VapC family toxin [Candidatus Desulfobacillus sp.]
MKLLLDTHTLLWWFIDDRRLSSSARAAILDGQNEIHVSAVNAWEIATKDRLGKLPEARDATPRFIELVAADGFRLLNLSCEHGLRAGGYPNSRGDPFDRMLAAQAEIESLTLVTRDPVFRDFLVQVLW